MTPKNPNAERPKQAGQRRRARGGDAELEMLAQLGQQAHTIIVSAADAQRDENFRSFSNYNAFRRKVGEFEAFCNIIEGHLKEVVSERREELEERFYSLWSMIFRPTLKALDAFFARMASEGVLPLGCRDLLNAELRALEAMRTALLAPRFVASADKAILDEIAGLKERIEILIGQATSLQDFAAHPPEAAEPAADEKDVPAPDRAGPAAAPTADSPQVRAVREFRALLDVYRRNSGFAPYVESDRRALEEIERKFAVNPNDAAALLWLRQIGSAWLSRLRDNDKELRRILISVRAA
jgi:hypothetical protein